MRDFKQVDLSNIKLMGGIGVILGLVGGFVPYIGRLLPIAGWVLELLALKRLSDETGREAIHKNFLIAVIVVTGGDLVISLLDIFPPFTSNQPKASGLSTLLPGFIFLWIIFSTSGYFVRRSFYAVAEVTGVSLFAVAGRLIFWGAVFFIIFGIGGIAGFFGLIVEAIAFFSLPDTLEVETTSEGPI